MKLSNETLTVLKNFASINQGIQFKKGNKLRTMSGGKNVLAEANLKDTFDDEFCVEDLNEFLSVHSLFKDKADLLFDDKNINFKNGRHSITYRKTAASMITVAPEKNLTLPTEDVKFTLSAEDYEWILKTCSVLKSPNIGIKCDGEKVEIVTFDQENDAAHMNSIQVDCPADNKYKIVYNTDNFKMIPGSYEVTISFKGLTHFKNTKDDIQYWIANEKKGTVVPA
jgi:hypothetical protein